MKQWMKRLAAAALAAAMSLSLSVNTLAQDGENITILFTHDLHSHFLPSNEDDGGQFGGYARLMTVIKEQMELYPDAILVDGGDFSMGSLFQTAFADSALELRMMGAMGYDYTTLGNHEFDYLPSGLAQMFRSAADSGEPLPAIVEANYRLPKEGEEKYSSDTPALQEAIAAYDEAAGYGNYSIHEENGQYFVVLGIMGYDSDECAPNSGMILEEPAQVAQAVVDSAVAECRDKYQAEPVVICLSHSGTSGGEGEDFELAQQVDGIDVIVSAHTHTTLKEPIQVNDTIIVSAGEYGKYLGVVQLEKKGEQLELSDYQLIPIDETVAEDPEIAALVENYKGEVEENYLSDYGLSFDQVLVNNQLEFDSVDDVYATAHESTLCNVFSDAYKWAVEEASGETVDMALTAAGVIRESLPLGDVTVSDVFNAASLGVGTEGELIAVYLTGKDLKTALEVDASVQPLMHSAQLFCSGVEYSFNTNRMLFNKVDYAMLRRSDGTLEAIDDEKMYRVVTGMYAGQMLGAVEETSFGLLSIVPRDEDGNAIAPDELVNFVVRDENGVAVKEWYAIASYLQQMDGQMDEQYAETDDRKVVYSSWNPLKLLSNANHFTYILLAVILVLVLLVSLVIRTVAKKIKKRKKR